MTKENTFWLDGQWVRVCRICGETKSLDDGYYKKKKSKSGVSTECKACHGQEQARYEQRKKLRESEIEPDDLPKLPRVPAKPLARLIIEEESRLDREWCRPCGDRGLASVWGVSQATLHRIRCCPEEKVNFLTADTLLQKAGRLFWEVFDEAEFPELYNFGTEEAA